MDVLKDLFDISPLTGVIAAALGVVWRKLWEKDKELSKLNRDSIAVLRELYQGLNGIINMSERNTDTILESIEELKERVHQIIEGDENEEDENEEIANRKRDS